MNYNAIKSLKLSRKLIKLVGLVLIMSINASLLNIESASADFEDGIILNLSLDDLIHDLEPNAEPIEIDGNSDTMNWNDCENIKGLGIPGIPYRVKNLIFDGNEEGSCIKITNSKAYVIIENCVFINAKASNQEKDAGICISYSKNIKIRNCEFYNNIAGVTVKSSQKISVLDSIFSFNEESGIFMPGSERCTIKGNSIYNTKRIGFGNGIMLRSSYDNRIINNTIQNNLNRGIFLSTSSDNEIQYNFVCNNTDIGIHVRTGVNNSFKFNTLMKNKIGLVLEYSKSRDNVVSQNILCDNHICEAQDIAEGENQWDDGKFGNYWGNYEIIYPNAQILDGFWDTKYVLPATKSNECDNHPLGEKPIIKYTNFRPINYFYISLGVFACGGVVFLIIRKKKN
ncbi:nitrous oxide reductase family maturation protein NosD [Candidatus Lokiarchaeum ossiferum]|uniref:nitrous oxide reductase family maturation protein NosD n=1 Tax=Candidatus Lokiarchaeum ossiferum TaxID=2951803 RepID=UPI00352C8A10